VLSILLCSRVLLPAAPKSSDSGVPAGWSALQYDNYGNDLLNKRKPVESRKYFDAAIRIEPSRWTAYYNRAVAFRLEKNWKAAINDLNETIRLQPAFFQASWDRALTYEAMGDYTTAIKELNALAKVTYQVGNPYEMAADAEPAGLDSRNLCERVISGWKVCGGRRQESL